MSQCDGCYCFALSGDYKKSGGNVIAVTYFMSITNENGQNECDDRSIKNVASVRFFL